MYASEIRAQLDRLHLERLEAEATGLTSCAAYMADLEDEIAQCRAAYVGAAVTEIAIARAELSGRLAG
jgi:CelD/BcsL family acetyltransferase involved in cellulose biosynthesis